MTSKTNHIVWRGEPVRIIVMMVLCAASIIAATPAPAAEGDIIVLREVAPRVAYRGLPRDEMPVQAVVDTFPNQQFAQATDLELGGVQAEPIKSAQARMPMALSSMGIGAQSTLLGDSLIGGGRRNAGGGIADRVQQATSMIPGAISQGLAPLSGAQGGQR